MPNNSSSPVPQAPERVTLPEELARALERVSVMIADTRGETYDLSPNDRTALKAIVRAFAAAQQDSKRYQKMRERFAGSAALAREYDAYVAAIGIRQFIPRTLVEASRVPLADMFQIKFDAAVDDFPVDASSGAARGAGAADDADD